MKKHNRITLALSFGEGEALPTEFRLFVAGWNKTENGDFLFDEAAAAQVMAAYEAWGVDLSIDLDHQMLDSFPSPDPTARDARGWAKLELRADGSLWAVDVKWTPDGAARLSEKRQRYVSPAFEIDPESKRVKKIINVAITALPATHDTPALVAAAARNGGTMDPELVVKAVDALEAGDANAALEILKGLIVAAASGGEPPPDSPPADAPPPDAPPQTNEADASLVAAARVALKLTGLEDPGAAMAELGRRSDIAVEVEAERAKLAVDRAKLEGFERKNLVADLVKLGVEIPATAWADDTASKPCERLQAEPIEGLRDRVAKLRAAKPAPNPAPKPPVGEEVQLSARELQMCTELNIDPKKYAANKTQSASKKG